MFCPFCGTKVPDTVAFCPECGKNIANEREDEPSVASSSHEDTVYFESYASIPTPEQRDYLPVAQSIPLPDPHIQQTSSAPVAAGSYKDTVRQAEQAGLGMKWYKFLVYFALFANCVCCVITAVIYAMGSHYGLGEYGAGLVYTFYPSLKTVDILFALVCLALAVGAIYTRMLLTRFSKNAPMGVYVLYGVSAACTLLYSILSSSITGQDTGMMASSIISLISSGIVIALSVTYFRKRSQYFIN